MKILSTGDFFGNQSKFLELLGTVKLLKPEILLITGDMFPPINSKADLENQIAFIPNYVSFLEKYSKYCQYILYIAGDSESVLTHSKLEEILKNKLSMIHCLNENSFKFRNYHFIGMPYVRDTKNILKDWVRNDRPFVALEEENGLYTENNNLHEINSYEFIVSKPTCSEILQEKILNCDKKDGEYLILVSHFPPFANGIMNETEYMYSIHNIMQNFKYVFSGHDIDLFLRVNNWNFEINKSVLFNPSQIKEILCYCYIIENNNVVFKYHPLEREPSFLLQNILNYKSIIDIPNESLNGLGDSIAKFLHTGVVGKIVKDLTGMEEPCLDCKRRQELLNSLMPFKN